MPRANELSGLITGRRIVPHNFRRSNLTDADIPALVFARKNSAVTLTESRPPK
jgi:hypothetical protein